MPTHAGAQHSSCDSAAGAPFERLTGRIAPLERPHQRDNDTVAATAAGEWVCRLSVAQADPAQFEIETGDVEGQSRAGIESRFIARCAIDVVALAAQDAAVRNDPHPIGNRLSIVELAVHGIAEAAEITRCVMEAATPIAGCEARINFGIVVAVRSREYRVIDACVATDAGRQLPHVPDEGKRLQLLSRREGEADAAVG